MTLDEAQFLNKALAAHSAEVPIFRPIPKWERVLELSEGGPVSNLAKSAPTPLIPAAQYLRMSTDDQVCSIELQAAAIKRFAEEHGYNVLATYSDPGKSGLALKGRKGLAQLLKDVSAERVPFKTILVYDVSRWGRFQDLDEAAHYEFLCKSHGIPVRYCAEQFSDDMTLADFIMKTLKRTMAAEYSRELSVKTLAAQKHLAKKGFRVAGTPGIGLRRMIVSADGRIKLIVEKGERKALHAYRTILVPGPKDEVEAVRRIFKLALQGNSCRKIARCLNRKHVWPWEGKGEHQRWTLAKIYDILTNEKYMGCNVYNKFTSRLSSPNRLNPVSEQIIVPGAFTPLIDPPIFRKVQSVIKSRGRKETVKPDEFYLDYLRRLLKRDGRVTQTRMRYSCVIRNRFGSVLKAYEEIGFDPGPQVLQRSKTRTQLKRLRNNFFEELHKAYPQSRIVPSPRNGETKQLRIDLEPGVRIAIYMCTYRNFDRRLGRKPLWVLCFRGPIEYSPALVCLPDPQFTKIESMYLVPDFGELTGGYISFASGDRLLRRGKKVTDLAKLGQIAREMIVTSRQEEQTHFVGDVMINQWSPIVQIAGKKLTLRPIDAELFKTLVRNHGVVLGKQQLLHPFLHREFENYKLKFYISRLRKTLGSRFKRRIKIVGKRGVIYVPPGEKTIRLSDLPSSPFQKHGFGANA